jgi:hypothetical protein
MRRINPLTQATIDLLDFQASNLELEASAKRDVIVTTPATAATKRRASQAAREARSLRRKIQKIILKHHN